MASKRKFIYWIKYWCWDKEEAEYYPVFESFRYGMDAERRYDEICITLDVPQVSLTREEYEGNETISEALIAFKENYVPREGEING